MVAPRLEAESRLDDPDDRLLIGEGVALDVPAASALIRAGGTAIDVVATIVVLLVTTLIVTNLATDEITVRTVMISALVVCLVVVPTVVETTTRGRSLGKFALGLRVVRDDGGAIGLRHALIRSLTAVLEIYMTVGGLAAVFGFTSRSSKRLGDLLAGTHARVERVPRFEANPVEVPHPLAVWAATADAGRLPSPLARRAASFVRNAPHLAPASRTRLARELAAEIAPFVTPVPDAAPELLVAAVVALRGARDARALELEAAKLAMLDPELTAIPNGFPRR